MSTFSAVSLGAAFLSILQPGAAFCGYHQISSPLIARGNESDFSGKWPWLAFLEDSWGKHFCGGSLIAPNIVLTAVHCGTPARVLFGKYYRDADLDSDVVQMAEVKQRIVHPDYIHRLDEHNNTRQMEADLALLVLKSDVNFTKYVQPICLPSTEEHLHNYSECVIAGWGLQSSRGDPPYVLQEAEVTLGTTCPDRSSAHPHTILCTSGYGVSTCNGDSGGPLACRRSRSAPWNVLGVVSYGICARKSFFMRVPHFLAWINEQIRELLKPMWSEAINWNGNWAMGCDFPGNDLRNEQMRGEDCGGRCAAVDQCTHFSWTQDNGGTCWMKTGSVNKGIAQVSGKPGAVCGVIRKSGDEVEANGRTTRYWDCCKPSCGWGGKVSNSDSYVRSCRSDGISVIGNNYTRNGCEGGGEAFTCSNQKPWAINDNLAYGFAAASIPGLSEQQVCCACYKLDFNSGPVSGKSMIVQVTNSGSDFDEGQFNLAIPGGGVGIFNGCQSQWGAPSGGWGRRYGGVSLRDQCGALPEQIRDGCFFRFDWFRGADNPTMTYTKVGCPSELTSISGCTRND